MSCYSGEKTPELDIDKETIVDILVDLHIAQAVVRKFPVIRRDSISQVYKKQIAEVYGKRSEALDSLIITLESYPSYFYELNGLVLEKIEKMEQDAQVSDSDREFSDDIEN